MPEPVPMSWSFGLDNLMRLRRDQLGFYQALQARHGDAIPLRFGPWRNWLLFHPDSVEAVLATEADTFGRFRPTMRILSQWTGDGLFVVEGERWRTRRRQVLPAFASRRLPGYAERIVRRAASLRARWEAEAVAGVVEIDTDREMIALTLGIVGDTLFGQAVDDVAGGIADCVAALSEIAFKESTAVLRLPAAVPTAHNRRKTRVVSTLRRIVSEIVERRLCEHGSDRGDLLSKLVETCGPDTKALGDEVMTLLIAGHETSSAALTWIAMLLGVDRSGITGRLREEIASTVAGPLPELGDLASMPLLRATVQEALRLYPPGYTMFLRRALADVDLAGAQIRRGDIVQVVPWITHRDPRWFPEPDAFRPERFLVPPTWPTYAYFPFGAGARVCVGEHFALMETALAMATLLQRFVPEAPAGPVLPEAKFSLRPAGGLPQRWRQVAGPPQTARPDIRPTRPTEDTDKRDVP